MKNDFKYPEGATPLDPDEIEGLRLKYITTREELNRWEQDNINDALDWVKKHRQGDILTEKFIKTLHQKMFGKVWRCRKGQSPKWGHGNRVKEHYKVIIFYFSRLF
jgi:fido (protein-threonine AMPylation protein)